jgi:Secretory lipase
LRLRTIAFAEGTASAPMKTTQLLYVTTDELGCRTVSVVTVFQPLDSAGSATTRLLSYETSYDALGAQCDPSYTLRAGTEGETGFIRDNITAGYTVVMADYEGEDAAYGAGQQNGYETLDAIRAAEKLLGVPEISTPVGMLGYSGGAVATDFASELAPAYAPHLDIVGVAEGGIPVDLFHDLAYIDTPSSSWTGQIPSYLDGLARGFNMRNLDKYLTPRGIAAVDADRTQCAGTFAGLTTDQMFKPQYQDIEKIPAFVRIFNRLIMSRTGTPHEPLLIGNGLADSIGDGVTVTKDVQELAYTYCHRGVPVEFHIYHRLNHSEAGTPFFEQAQAFLAQRFKNLPFHNGCAHISPGNSIAPIPVPVS